MSETDDRTTSVAVDGDRLLARLARLAKIGSSRSGGVTREAYGPLDVEARDLVAGWMRDAGLAVEVDAAANLIGRRPGPSGRWLATGSHLDTVVDAGPFDGAFGAVAGVEVAAALRGVESMEHGLMVVAFANEEGARGSDGMVGSRALVGEVPDGELSGVDDGGVSLDERLIDAGGDPGLLADARWDVGEIDAFVELHVEQGPVLDEAEESLGVVLGITGRQAVDIVLRGAPNHAGTTPMHLRVDAMAAAAELVLAIEAMARDGGVRVATCGHLHVRPNVRNVIPGEAFLSAELRDDDLARLGDGRALVEGLVAEVDGLRGTTGELTWGQLVEPVDAHPDVVAAVRAAAEASGRPWRTMWSGAGHDAQILGRHLPMGMIFVPSVGGVSHAPEETTDPEHLVLGAQVLADTLVALDGRGVG